MLTMEDKKNRLGMDWDEWNMYCNHLREIKKTLMDIYRENINNGTNRPDDTIDKFVETVGMDDAITLIASLVNFKAWDGRIDYRNAEWAKNITNAWDRDGGREMGMYVDSIIHTSHLDQLAYEMRRKAV